MWMCDTSEVFFNFLHNFSAISDDLCNVLLWYSEFEKALVVAVESRRGVEVKRNQTALTCSHQIPCILLDWEKTVRILIVSTGQDVRVSQLSVERFSPAILQLSCTSLVV